MQLPFSCLSQTLDSIESTLSSARLARYMGGAAQDRLHALQLYTWNARLCEAFYLPTQVAEVATRNAIHAALKDKFGNTWYQNGAYLCTLPQRLRDEMDKVIQDEKFAYGTRMNVDHLVSGLSFGFWLNLMTSRYDGVLWPRYIRRSFPGAPRRTDRQILHKKLDGLRTHRNRIAHHKPIFDRNPTTKFGEILEILSWVCDDTHWFIQHTSRVSQTINSRPPTP